MSEPAHKSLIVYKKAKSLTVEVVKCFLKQNAPVVCDFVTKQLLRSTSSIGANIAEGCGNHYRKSFRHYLCIARGSFSESEYWFEVVIELKIFDNKVIESFLFQNKEIIKMLTVMMKNLEKETQS